jgi:hypothetical protein
LENGHFEKRNEEKEDKIEMVGSDSGLCPTAGFGISDALSGSTSLSSFVGSSVYANVSTVCVEVSILCSPLLHTDLSLLIHTRYSQSVVRVSRIR